jgi:hypothetical protein
MGLWPALLVLISQAAFDPAIAQQHGEGLELLQVAR